MVKSNMDYKIYIDEMPGKKWMSESEAIKAGFKIDRSRRVMTGTKGKESVFVYSDSNPQPDPKESPDGQR